jgi:hypothetical protein
LVAPPKSKNATSTISWKVIDAHYGNTRLPHLNFMRKRYCLFLCILWALPGVAQKKQAASKALQKKDLLVCKVESDAYFPDGNSAWLKYIETNNQLDSIYQLLPGKVVSWTVFVQFVVNRNGAVEVTGITGDTTFHPLFRAEIYRLFQQSPRWIPAEQNGRKIKALRQQKIGFKVEEDRTGNNSPVIQRKDSIGSCKDSIHIYAGSLNTCRLNTLSCNLAVCSTFQNIKSEFFLNWGVVQKENKCELIFTFPCLPHSLSRHI